MRNFRLLLSTILSLFSVLGITQEEISGTINQYTAITAIDYDCNILTVNSSVDFEVDQKVLLIQMKGATINTSNSASFGIITDLANTGKYEISEIQAINGNVVNLKTIITNEYDLSGLVQLVSVPVYNKATVSDTLKAVAWNGTIGGVLSLIVNDTLVLNAPLDASSMGFRGGISNVTQGNNCSFITNANDYFYELNNWRAAGKGEGIAPIISGQESGRGVQATGGGGGNDHNAGGGGGSNLGAGGQGGINNEPSFFGCSGNFPGLGALSLNSTDDRIYLGGGGGGGHENNNVGSNGGNGGGIIIVVANVIVGNGQTIQANGQIPDPSLGDGAGGGGAGGSVILLSEQLIGNLNISANGGNGGTANNTQFDRCMGPGGGGGGGLVGTNLNPAPTISTQAGLAGMSINSALSECPDGTNGANSGTNGDVQEIEALPEGPIFVVPEITVSQPNSIVACFGETTMIEIEVEGSVLEFQWEIDTGLGFTALSESPPFSGTQTNVLTIEEMPEAFENDLFRLIINTSCFDPVISNPIAIEVAPAPLSDFTFTFDIDDLSVSFNNLSENADSIFWQFGDNNNSEDVNPQHTYAEEGMYTVELQVFNSCGMSTSTQVIPLGSAPIAGFSAEPLTGCAPLEVFFIDESSFNVDTYFWSLPGGTPNFSNDADPIIEYNVPGTYDITQIVSNAFGSDTIETQMSIDIQGPPTANFTASTDGLTIAFNNQSVNATSYFWDFGDNSTSMEEDPPIHIYENPGTYTIELTATNNCGSVIFTQTITINAALSAAFSAKQQSGCTPQQVHFFNQSTGDVENLMWNFPGGTPPTSTEPNPIVLYEAVGQYDVSLNISGPGGTDMITLEDFVEVFPTPIPDFSFDVDGLTVVFQNNSTEAINYTWNFGDDDTSTEENPVHTFPEEGVYEVTLTALNSFCARTETQTIVIMNTGVEEISNSVFRIFPNPVSDILTIEAQGKNNFQTTDLKIYDARGQLIDQSIFRDRLSIDMSGYPTGVYLIKLNSEGQLWMFKTVKN